MRRGKYRASRSEWGSQLKLVQYYFSKEDSGVVLDDLMAATRLEARSDVCPSWRRRHFPSDVVPLTEWEGAKGAVSMVNMVRRTSQRLRQDVDKMCFGHDVRAGMLMTASANDDESAVGLLFSFQSIMTEDSWREGTGQTRV